MDVESAGPPPAAQKVSRRCRLGFRSIWCCQHCRFYSNIVYSLSYHEGESHAAPTQFDMSNKVDKPPSLSCCAQTLMVPTAQRQNTLRVQSEVQQHFPPLRHIIEYAQGVVSKTLVLNQSPPVVFIVRQGVGCEGGTNFCWHRDDDAEPGITMTFVIKLSEPASHFEMYGSKKSPTYPEGCGHWHLFTSSMWHQVAEGKYAVKLIIHFAGMPHTLELHM